ncbi:hypothetical protein ACFFGT_04780 [Mucilaginibacter angelicae]|uniref:Uncharacterized protein n=1 Tax=Mucilaginibacter angelicae TaxID=869718 RepID=A0ABV6L194_9SPHI
MARSGKPGAAWAANRMICTADIEAFINGVMIGRLYAPNGNPFPGPKFDYKLLWLERLITHAQKLLSFGLPAALVGDYNIMPTDPDTYKPDKYRNNAQFRKEVRELFETMLAQGWTGAIRKLYPNKQIYTFTCGRPMAVTPACGSTIFY